MFEAIHFEISFIFKKQVTEIGKSSNNLQWASSFSWCDCHSKNDPCRIASKNLDYTENANKICFRGRDKPLNRQRVLLFGWGKV